MCFIKKTLIYALIVFVVAAVSIAVFQHKRFGAVKGERTSAAGTQEPPDAGTSLPVPSVGSSAGAASQSGALPVVQPGGMINQDSSSSVSGAGQLQTAQVAAVHSVSSGSNDHSAKISVTANYFNETVRVAALGKDLPRSDIERLYDYLRLPVDSNPELDHVAINSVKNDIMDKLLAQSELPEDLGRVLVDLYEDRSNDELLRNYSVQHFELFLQQKAIRGQLDVNAPDIKAVRSAFVSALEEKHNSLAGVALLGMERAAEHDPAIDRGIVSRKALLYASDPVIDEGTRIAAVQVCGVLKETSVRPVLRGLVRDAEAIPLRLAAIHALGEVGDGSDVDILNNLAQNGGRFVGSAAAKALAELNARLAR